MELHMLSVKDVLEHRLCKARCLVIEAKLEPYDPDLAAAWSDIVGSTEDFIRSLEELLQDIVKPRTGR